MTAGPNIFTVMQKVSSRVEPYHSAYLAAMLEWSHGTDRVLFDAFWLRAAPPSWELPGSEVVVLAEESTPYGRVDLVLLIAQDRALGIEVKTREASTTGGQLERYRKGLSEKYPNRDVAMAFLTPFDRSRAGDAAAALQSIVEFDAFAEDSPLSRHLSWLDIAEIDWEGGELWTQHREFVRTVISSEESRLRWTEGGRSRELAAFFGADAAEVFDQRLQATGVGPLENHVLDLTRVREPDAFAAAFRVLIESQRTAGTPARTDRFSRDVRERLLRGPAASVHRALFALADEFPHVWLQGTTRYGLRVVHPHHPSGVSMATSRGDTQLEIGRPR